MASGTTIQRRRREATERRDDLCVWAGWLMLDGRAVPGWQAAAHVAAEAAVETEGREDGAGGGPAEGRRRGSRVHVTGYTSMFHSRNRRPEERPKKSGPLFRRPEERA